MGIFKSYGSLKVGLHQMWIVQIVRVIFLIFLHSCNLLLILSPGNPRKLETYGYIQKLWHFKSRPPTNVNCANCTCYLFDFFAQMQSPVNTESREPKKIENLWVYSQVMALWNVTLQKWFVQIVRVIFLICLHNCILLLILSPGNQRKLETYGYI